MLLIIIWYFFDNYFWPRPRSRPRSSGLGLVVLASFNITAEFMPYVAVVFTVVSDV